MKAFTYIGAASILYILYKYLSDGTRRGDPKRMERPPSLYASSSSSSNPRDNYDVFLSFTIRGGTWRTFTSHLHSSLEQKGIYTFLDVKKIERGKDISPGLDNGIKSSRCSVVVLSEQYTSSHWCMDELVQILKCRKDSNINQIVLPIFYHVNPNDIEKGFQSLEKKFCGDKERVKSWRDALIQLPGIAGHHVDNTCTTEAIFIEDFIKVVSSKLFDAALLNISKDFVGMDSRLEKLKLCVSTSPFRDVRFIGIFGLGGLGKTTLARAYFKYMSCHFQGSSFLANVRQACEKEHGLVKLQKQLLTDVLKEEHSVNNVFEGKDMIKTRLCRKKILVVLDDVNKLNQLEGLAEENNWFGDGSQIIVTTRDESLLRSMYDKKEYIIHKVDQLEDREALQLFSLKAFKRNCPPEDYRELSMKVIKYASGLPLALVVLGSFLRGKESIDEWEDALDRLNEYSDEEIMRVLRISFDGLVETEKNIFLDIACFFNGHTKDYVMKIMDSCGFYPKAGIRSLLNKSLLHIDHDRNKLRMHDLLEEMGKQIVRGESRKEPGRQSRIWLAEDFFHFMNNGAGTEAVEAIVCPYIMMQEKNVTTRGFSNMKKLRLLIIISRGIMCCPDNEYLPNELRYLSWNGFPLKSFPRSFQPHGLVELSIHSRVIERLWDNPMMKPLYNLKSINLSGSLRIRKLENFSLFPNLEKLILRYCGLRDGAFPDDFGCLVLLEYVDLSRNKFSCLPAHFNQLSKLRHLDLSHCENLTSLGPELPDSLERIKVNYCGELQTFLDPLSQCNQQCSEIYCVDCFKLVNRQGSKRTASTLLGRYLQTPPKPRKRFDIVLPGNEIPSWFTHKVMGSSSISLPLYPNWCTNKWMGFALSLCFSTTKRLFLREWYWEIKINQEDWGFGHVHWAAKEYWNGKAYNNNIWLLYLPRDTYFHSEWQKKFGQIQFSFKHPQEVKIVEFKQCGVLGQIQFKHLQVEEIVEFKQCGVHLVYEQDIEVLNLTARDEPIELPAEDEDKCE